VKIELWASVYYYYYFIFLYITVVRAIQHRCIYIICFLWQVDLVWRPNNFKPTKVNWNPYWFGKATVTSYCFCCEL